MCQPPLAFGAFHWIPVRKTNNRNRPGLWDRPAGDRMRMQPERR
jgi:hypothetical protein